MGCPKGAIWGKWDLHVHTPASYVNNFRSWDSYIEKLNEVTKNKDIKVLGITDYFSIDGYEEITTKYKDRFENVELILPNIEFRLDNIVYRRGSQEPKRLNFHVIFSNEIDVQDIRSQFLGDLHFYKSSGGAGELSQIKLDKGAIECYGAECKSQPDFEKDTDLQAGTKNIVFKLDEIVNALKKKPEYFKDKYLLFLESEFWSDINWGQDYGLRKTLLQVSHGVFDSNTKDIAWFLGSDKNAYAAPEKFIEEFGRLFPCVHGSDAHNEQELDTRPDLDRYCWIKADTTFEGLKQIIYEPEGRVKIQEDMPESKLNYLVIDKVRFFDSSNKNFSNEWIELNPNLNSIIGGKSSGKSLLLYHIAKTIIAEKAEKRIKSGDKSIRYDYKFTPEIDFEVLWRDGTLYKLSDAAQEKDRSITFIPQLYLNALAEEKGEGSDFRNVIENILVGNKTYASFLSGTKSRIDEYNLKLHGAVSKYLSTRKSIIEEKDNLKGLGDKKAIKKAISSYEQSLRELRDESKFTDKEEDEYKALQVQKEKLQEQVKRLTKEKGLLGKIKAVVLNMAGDVLQSVIEPHFSQIRKEYTLDDDSLKTIDQYVRDLEELLRGPLTTFGSEKFARLEVIDGETIACLESFGEIEGKIKPYEEKLTNKAKFEKVSGELRKEVQKIFDIEKKELEITSLQKGWNTNEIFQIYEQLYNCYINTIAELKQYSKIDSQNGIDLISEVKFNNIRFEENFSAKISKKTSLDKQFGTMFLKDSNEFIFRTNLHVDDVRKIFDRLVDGHDSVKLNLGFTLDDVVHALVDDNFYIEYDLKQGDDRLLQMSPGKRGIILFQLFLQLSNATTPILIDQPEDNLDNRTVYRELNNFIKRKKLDRQIIIVSHNANLVVSTDSEDVIVANQHGENKEGENAGYRFEYVTGALENKFEDVTQKGILYQKGIRNHVCEILEGGEEAFKKREQKYALI